MQIDQGIKPSNYQCLKPSHFPNKLLNLSTNGTSSLDISSGLSLNQNGSLSLIPSAVPSVLSRSFKYHSLRSTVFARPCILLPLNLSAKSTVVLDSIPKINLHCDPTSVQPSLFYNVSLGLRMTGASLSIIPSNLLPSLFPTPVLFNPSLFFEIQELGGGRNRILKLKLKRILKLIQIQNQAQNPEEQLKQMEEQTKIKFFWKVYANKISIVYLSSSFSSNDNNFKFLQRLQCLYVPRLSPSLVLDSRAACLDPGSSLAMFHLLFQFLFQVLLQVLF